MGSERTPKGTADEKGRTAMQRTGQRAGQRTGSPDKGLAMTMGTAERKRVEAVVETLSMAGSRGETLAEVAHDARNMVTALGLYCDLLEEPGVLAAPFAHYGSELQPGATNTAGWKRPTVGRPALKPRSATWPRS